MEASIWVALIGGIALIINTYLSVRQRRQLGEVHEQVKNTHSTNFREDMDEALEGISHLKREFANVRRELRQERAARIKLQELVDAELLRRRGNRVRQ